MTSGIVYRTSGPHGPGKGSNLTPTEVDANFFDLDGRVQQLELFPPQPIEISTITVVGSAMTVNMADGSKFGPFTLPVASFKFVGNWSPITSFFKIDVFLEPSDGVYLVLVDYESATDFDPGASEIVKMLPDEVISVLEDVGDVDYNTAGPIDDQDVLVRRGGLWVHERALGRFARYFPVADMIPTVTDGAGSHNTDAGLQALELTVGQPNLSYFAFDQFVEQHLQWHWDMPERWGGHNGVAGTNIVRFEAVYSHEGGQTGGLDGVAWGLQVAAIANGQDIDKSFGTEIQVTKNAVTGDFMHRTVESADVVPSSSGTAPKTLNFQISRVVGSGGDDLDLDARLHGIMIFVDFVALTDTLPV